MKNIILIISMLACACQSRGQNATCNLTGGIPQLREVYVFSENRNHTMQQLFGEEVPQMLLNIVYVHSTAQQAEIDNHALKGELQGSIFIFPEPNGTRRYCTTEAYSAYLTKQKE